MLWHMRCALSAALIFALLGAASGRAGTAAPEAPQTRSCQPIASGAPAWATFCIRQASYYRDTCSAIQFFAWRELLPSGYFARLIWQESRFDPHALSTAGAQGIAQFIPSTAKIRALRDPFDPVQALQKSAEYLRFLSGKFGNLGLAAVAYNGGEGRASRYVAGVSYLPLETRNYVETITGQTPDFWLANTSTSSLALNETDTFIDACLKLAAGQLVPRLDRPPGEWMPWGVMLAQNFSQAVAIRRFERVQAAYPAVLSDEKLMLLMARNPNFGPRLRHYAMIGRNTREEAETLCASLQKAGGSCIVRKN